MKVGFDLNAMAKEYASVDLALSPRAQRMTAICANATWRNPAGVDVLRT
jgi:hypothetical protein